MALLIDPQLFEIALHQAMAILDATLQEVAAAQAAVQAAKATVSERRYSSMSAAKR